MKTFFISQKSIRKGISASTFMATMLVIGYLLSPGSAHGEGEDTLKVGASGKALFDFRTSNPEMALVYLNLIGDTYKDKHIQSKASHPDFVVIFGGGSVKLLAMGPKGYAPQEIKTIDAVKKKITALALEGIEFDYCMYGGNLFGVVPANIAGVGVIDNGWVSLVNYQANGYSIIPAY